jgi:carboxypeptidase Q
MQHPASSDVVNQLIAYTNDSSTAYHHLETLCICFPGRVTGSDILESALDFLVKIGVDEMGLQGLREEKVDGIPHWVRAPRDDDSDKEKLVVVIDSKDIFPVPNPLRRVMRIMANGMSVGTSETGISGPILLCKSIEELKSFGKEAVEGRIVLLDYGSFTLYKDMSAPIRGGAAIEASRMGAACYLHRVLAPDGSTSGLHTGTIYPFPADVKPIPSAAVTIEDSELLSRLIRRGYALYGNVTLPCRRYADKASRNIIFEIAGSGPHADEVVLIGGHTDSWECHHLSCQGAHDDGQGVIVCMETLRSIQQCGLVPARTIRCVLFVDEEVRQSGADEYLRACTDVDKIVVALETDLGAGPVVGFGYTGGLGGAEVVSDILRPMSALNSFKAGLRDSKGNPLCKECDCVNRVDPDWLGWGVDTWPLVINEGVPGLLLRHEGTWWDADYFHNHHTASDCINNVDPGLLLLNQHAVTLATWLLANATDVVIPRGEKEKAPRRRTMLDKSQDALPPGAEARGCSDVSASPSHA